MPISKRLLLLITLSFPIILLTSCAVPEKRIALVIGNQSYISQTPLDGARRDADKVSSALANSGFTVKSLTDLRTYTDLYNAMEEFAKSASDADVAVFYFAGHGMQLDGYNYLLPLDATNIGPESDIESQAVGVGVLLSKQRNKSSAMIVMLDACRNNSSGSEGLAGVAPPAETLVAFATLAGQIARDDNGLYAQAFQTQVQTLDGARVETVFSHITTEVKTKSGGTQTPIQYTNLSNDVYFRKKRHAKLVFTY